MRPVIGITPLMDTKLDSYWMLPDYMQAVQQAGGLPLMLPFQYDDESIDQMVELCDGLIFTGGEDIDPSWYHAGLRREHSDPGRVGDPSAACRAGCQKAGAVHLPRPAAFQCGDGRYPVAGSAQPAPL